MAHRKARWHALIAILLVVIVAWLLSLALPNITVRAPTNVTTAPTHVPPPAGTSTSTGATTAAVTPVGFAMSPAALSVRVTLRNVGASGALTITVYAAPRARISAVVRVEAYSISATHAGTQHEPAALYQVDPHGVVGIHGQFNAGLRLVYRSPAPLLAAIAVRAVAPSGTTTFGNRYVVYPQPHATYTLAPLGPRQLYTVPANAFPPHQGFGDARFGVVEAFAVRNRADDLHVGWERVQIRWDQVQPNGPTQWNVNATEHDKPFDDEIAHGRRLVGVIQGIPAWAAQNPADGNRAVPRNLDLPWSDPGNYWGQFVFRAARHYAGRIDTLVILNEVNISSGPYRQFAGTPQQYAQMLRVAYLAAHAANPHVEVHVYGDSVYADQGAWFQATVDALARFPNARANNFFFDAAEVHLYNTVIHWDTIIARWRAIMRAHGFDRPIWLSETNVAPRDDRDKTCNCWAHPADHNIPLAQQPDFIVTAFATALGLNLPREEIYRMRDPRVIWPEHPYGLVRTDGSLRPEYYAFKTANTWFAGVTAARYEPGGEPYADKRPIFRVVMERPGQEIQVLWNQSGAAATAVVPALAPTATVVRTNGTTSSIHAHDGRFTVLLGASTDRSIVDRNLYIVGGPPLIVVQALPAGRHVPGLRPLFVEANRGIGAGGALGPVSSVAVAPDGSGTRAIADTAHDRVLIEDAAGRVTALLGGTGGAPGRFRGPAGVAIGADGTLYVADQGNARIQEFDLAGHVLGGFGRYDAGPASLKAPVSVAVAPDGTLYVADVAQDAVLHFTRAGDLLGRWGSPGYGNGQLDGPGGIAAGADGLIYVADTLNNRVVGFDLYGHPLVQIGAGASAAGATSLRWPVAVAVLPDGGIAVADAGSARVVVAHPQTYLGAIAVQGVARPGGLAIATDGSYFVGDTANDRVVHLDAHGHVLGAFGSRGFGRGQFFQPMGLALGPDGNLYVADSGNNRIEVVTSGGRFVRHIGRQGQAPGQLLGPHAVSVASDGTLWVADTYNGRIQHLTAGGGVLGISVTHVNGAFGVAADGQGGVYYSAHWGQRIYHLSKNGRQQVWGGPGSGPGEFDHPTALAGTPDGGTVYVVDEGNARIQYLSDDHVAGQRGGPNPDASGLGDPVAVAVAADGTIAVLDAERHRIVFYRGPSADGFTSIALPDVPLGITAVAGTLDVSVDGQWSGITSQQTIPLRVAP